MSETALKIKVTPEGREGIWHVESGLIAWIQAQEFESIHHMRTDNPAILLGADWDVDSVLNVIRDAHRVAVMCGAARSNNLGHSLAVIYGDPERLELFDIGDVTEADFEVTA